MLVIFCRALLLYLSLVLFIRLMGKRQIGELQPFELVITLLVADLVASPMQDVRMPLVEGIIPMVALFAIHSLVALLTLKVAPLRKLICGAPSELITDGVINEQEMKKLGLSLPELLEGLRNAGVAEVNEVFRCLLETNGHMSVIMKKQAQSITVQDAKTGVGPDVLQMTVIASGKIDKRNLKSLSISQSDLGLALGGVGIKSLEEVFVALADQQGQLYVQAKGAKQMITTRVAVGS